MPLLGARPLPPPDRAPATDSPLLRRRSARRRLLHETLRRLGATLGAAAPEHVGAHRAADAERFCWRIEIMPRLAQLAGLEIGTGVHLNVLRRSRGGAAARRERVASPPRRAADNPTNPAVRRRAAQEPLPYGRWGEALAEQFRAKCDGIGEIAWFPDRTWEGRTYVPATAPAADGGEWFGFVSYTRASTRAQATDFVAEADFTEETADQNPDWSLDLSDHEIGHWRGTRAGAG